MDPTMGQAVVGQATFGDPEPYVPAPGMSAYLSVSHMQADQVGGTEVSGVVGADVIIEPVVEVIPPDLIAPATPPAPPAVVYPSGRVDFNKPFQVFDTNNDDDIHEDAKILTVLAGNTYPVVIVSRHQGEQVIGQFDTDGDEMNGELQVENLETEPRTLFAVVIRQGRDYSMHDGLFETEREAHGVYLESDQRIALVLPITIPAPGAVPLNDVSGLPDGVEAVEGDEDEDHHNAQVVEQISHPDAVWVNGRMVKPGDKVRATKKGEYVERTCTVIKTQADSKRSLYIQADEGGDGPYWALNKKIRPHY